MDKIIDELAGTWTKTNLSSFMTFSINLKEMRKILS